MDIDEEGHIGQMDDALHSAFSSSPDALKEHFPLSSLPENHYVPYPYPLELPSNPTLEPEMLPLSMPLNLAHLSSSGFIGSPPLLASSSSQDSHFNYDEQLAEDFEESEDDSSAMQIGPSLASSSSTRSFSDLQDYLASPEANYEPRRSNRERRPPAVFVLPSPPENPKPPKKPGRPGKNVPPRTRGRPRKHPLPTTGPTVMIAPTSPSTLSHDAVSNPTSPYSSSTNSPRPITPILPTQASNHNHNHGLAYTAEQRAGSIYYGSDQHDAHHCILTEDEKLAGFLPPSEAFGFRADVVARSSSSSMDKHVANGPLFPALQQFTGPAETWFKFAPPSHPSVPTASSSSITGSIPAMGFAPHTNSASFHPQQTRQSSRITDTVQPRLKFTLQASQTLECKSGVTCMALSPCGQLLACGTLLGQIFVFAAESQPQPSSSSTDDLLSTPTRNVYPTTGSEDILSPSPMAAQNGAGTFASSTLHYPPHQQASSSFNASPHMAPPSGTLSPSTTPTMPESSWESLKWVQIATLHDYNEDFIDEWWNIMWTPDARKIIVSGACKSRHIWDENDHDLKVLPSPIVVFDLEHYLSTSDHNTSSGTGSGHAKRLQNEEHRFSTATKRGDNLAPDSARSLDGSSSSSINFSHAGIRRFNGHAEEVVDMKIWPISETTATQSGSRSVHSHLLITSSQDGHVRKWKFDEQWRRLEYSTEMKDETTWMAFSVSRLSFSESSLPQEDQPTSLFLLAGDATLKLFDFATNHCIFTFDDIYDAYCTKVEILRLSFGLEHPWKPGCFLNGDGNVYRDSECTTLAEFFAPTFLVLTKGIDVINTPPKPEKSKEKKGGQASDSDEFDEDDYVPRKSANQPTRLLLHVLTLPMITPPKTTITTTTTGRKIDLNRRASVDTQAIELQTVMSFSHPLFESNYWPSNLAHNGQHILSVGNKGTVFSWNVIRSNVDRNPAEASLSSSGSSASAPQFAANHSNRSAKTGSIGTTALSAYQNSAQAAPQILVNASSHISAILATHDEESMVRDVLFHPYWPFLFTSSDDASIHVWSPAIFDPSGAASGAAKVATEPPQQPHHLQYQHYPQYQQQGSSAPIATSQPEAPHSSMAMTTPCIIVPKGTSLAFSKLLPSGGFFGGSTSSQNQQGSVYRTAIEAAMMASVGSLLPPVAKRKRGRPPKKKIIEEIEAQFAAQERALSAAHQQVQIINPFGDTSSTAPGN